MTRRKLFLFILILIVVSQVPFVYRRYRLGRLRNTIQALAAQRVTNQSTSNYVDYKGVIHVHTSLGGHSTGTFSELIAAAKANQLDFVIMTEHAQAEFDTAALTLNGVQSGVLFVNGNEVSTGNGDRLLLIPGSASAAQAGTQSTQEVIDKQRTSGGLTFAAYPSESGNWQSTSVDGVEVYNLYTNTKQLNKLTTFFDGIWSYRGFPDLMFANFFTRPDENLRRWDEANANRKLIAIGGNDAHSNVGFGLGDATGKQLLGVKLDPYERSFRTVRTHVLIKKDKPLTRESLLEAISLGHCYVSFDIFSEPTGFQFAVTNTDQIMGDRIYAQNEAELLATAPLASRFVLFKNGTAVEQKTGTRVQFTVTPTGIYRVEVYLDSLPAPAKGQPWIISNPIHVASVDPSRVF
ncbi:MAG TPA: hypothetical protein VJT71_01025 [Pyrinomonadaceae bacterium]|nr:hypothetical protein [Pyrinomonadaceae bacterium]